MWGGAVVSFALRASLATSTKVSATALLIGGAILVGGKAAAIGNAEESKKVRDLQVDVLALPQRVMKQPLIWVSADQVVVTALRDDAEIETLEEEAPSRVLLVDVRTKAIRSIAEDARIVDFDKRSGTVVVARTKFSVEANPHWTYFNLRELHIFPNGSVTVGRTFPPGTSPPDRTQAFPKDGLFQSMSNPADGYLLRVVKKGDTLLAQEGRARKTDEVLETVWIRPGMPLTPVPVRFDEVDSTEYVEFLDKFLLHDTDSKQSSATRGDQRGVWKRPYDFVPYRLLGRDGRVEEIPYPGWVREFGLEEPQRRNGFGYDFNRLAVTRPGVLIRKDFGHAANFYLYKDSQAYRLVGGDGGTFPPNGNITLNSTWLEQVSPDGCKVAFTHQNVEMSRSTWRDGYYLSIIDVCKATPLH